MAELQDLLERMKREGQLIRNSDKNSLKQTNRILGEMNTELVEIGKSLGVIRTVGVGGLGGGVVQVGAGSESAAAITPAVPQRSEDPELGIGGLLRAAIRNQTVGRVERGADAAKEAAVKKFCSPSTIILSLSPHAVQFHSIFLLNFGMVSKKVCSFTNCS